jgi:CO/xanthine dehydrogenase FAD-binding subunit
VSLGGIGERPVDLSEAAAAIVGTSVDEELVKEASRAVATAADPRGDERASAEYRRRLSEVLTLRALLSARDRARGEGDR